jgi:hypothetical protein
LPSTIDDRRAEWPKLIRVLDDGRLSVSLRSRSSTRWNQALEVRARASAAHGVGKEPGLAADDEGTDRVLHEVGVQRCSRRAPSTDWLTTHTRS